MQRCLAALLLAVLAGCTENYADGERIGLITQFSNAGMGATLRAGVQRRRVDGLHPLRGALRHARDAGMSTPAPRPKVVWVRDSPLMGITVYREEPAAWVGAAPYVPAAAYDDVVAELAALKARGKEQNARRTRAAALKKTTLG